MILKLALFSVKLILSKPMFNTQYIIFLVAELDVCNF